MSVPSLLFFTDLESFFQWILQLMNKNSYYIHLLKACVKKETVINFIFYTEYLLWAYAGINISCFIPSKYSFCFFPASPVLAQSWLTHVSTSICHIGEKPGDLSHALKDGDGIPM